MPNLPTFLPKNDLWSLFLSKNRGKDPLPYVNQILTFQIVRPDRFSLYIILVCSKVRIADI